MQEKLLGNEKMQENKTAVRKIGAMQEKHRYERTQEETIVKETEEAIKEKPLQDEQIQEKKSLLSGIDEALREIFQDKPEGKTESLPCYGQQSELKSEKNSSIGNIETATDQFELPAYCSKALSQDEKINLEVEEAMDNIIAISSDGLVSKSYIHAAKSELLSKSENQNPTEGTSEIQEDFPKDFAEIYKFQKDFPEVYERILKFGEKYDKTKASSEVDKLAEK